MATFRTRRTAVALVAIAAGLPNVAGPVVGALDSRDTPLAPLASFVTVDLGEKFRGFDLDFLDRDAVVADAEDGRLSLTLFALTDRERTFDLVVREKRIKTVFIDAESGAILPEAYEARFFLGSVAGDPGSRAAFSATSLGIDGYVLSAAGYFQFEPLGGLQGAPSPVGITVVYETKDLVPEDVPPAPPLPVPVIARDDSGPSGPAAPHGPEGELDHTNRRTDVGIDHDFRTTTAWTDWKAKAEGVAFRMDSNFENSAGWSMVGSTLEYEVCDTESCDGNHGMNGSSCSDVLGKFRDHSNGLLTHWFGGWQFRHFFTAHDFSGCLGLAYRPGRYSMTQVRNSGPYDGATSNHEAGQIMSQEVGHNLNAEHRHGYVSDHDHGFNHVHETQHCHLPDPPILGLCLNWHTHTSNHWHADWFTHVDIMKSGYCRDAGDNCGGSDPSIWHDGKGEWIAEFSSTAKNVMDTCNHNTCY